MLTQVSQSSKRLGKLKKYKSKIKGSGFDFLLQSLERDKENHGPNTLTANAAQLTHSLHIDPLMTAPVQAFTLSNNNQNNPPRFFLDNVKHLDNSDVSISDPNQSNPSKKSCKQRDNSVRAVTKSQKQKKNASKNCSQSSKQMDKGQFPELIYKMKQYLALTDEFLSDGSDPSQVKYRKKAQKISQQLVNLITNIQNVEEVEKKSTKMVQSVNTTSFNLNCGGDLNNKGDGNYMKIINSLEFQKDKLNNLISQHEMANIKMYIKLNEGQSEQIQQCKKQLALLFQKYKKLEGFITKDKKRIVELVNEKEKMSKHCEELTSQNAEMMELIEKYQQALSRQKQEKKNQVVQQVQNFDRKERKNINIFIGQGQHSRQQSNYSFHDHSAISRGDLHIESLNNSQNESRFSEQIGLGSSITTTTSRMAKKKGGKMGINLNALLQNMNQSNINRLVEDPEKLKRVIAECRQSIFKMEEIITEQNKQLELCIQSLQQYKEKVEGKDQIIKVLEGKLATLKKQREKQREKEKERERERQKEREKQREREKDKCKYMKQNMKENMKQNRMGNDSGMKSNRKKEKGKVFLDMDLSKNKYDEYRIIAMQAEALQEMLNSNKIR